MANADIEKLEKIKSYIEGIEFGSVVVTIHDGKITQIDRNEKIRFSFEKKKEHPDNSKLR
ncbi:DUF2292 domain-containing protein [Anaerobacillus alkaliphilus]|uniref:DUF2292 domain-containing protein n=1 Tax=Anaerobacillus alkaliphilus TaxID=1548597 RepID=A0A4Q0VMZ3_9BACI|nr:YezD family protein [Anaerobacillus alkaliphilus]RXI96414.1 DUF2292 domain-containing protein [Anaerobacillus alkaliphilus]